MGVTAILHLLIAVSTSLQVLAETSRSFNHNEPRRRIFGELLRPPPPPSGFMRRPPWSPNRMQRQNFDLGYQYPPLVPPPPQLAPTFMLPSPFSKPFSGYNYVPPPQPFFTTPSPGLFQKVSSWLFPQNNNQISPTLSPLKKDCNPCNLFPWIPVIRYNMPQIENPPYGPPSQIYPVPPQNYGPPNYVPAPPLSSPTPFYGTETPSFTTQIATFVPPTSTFSPTDVDVFDPQGPPPQNLGKLPKISIPTGFKNSYGEPITATYSLNQFLPVPATAAESSKLKPEFVAPDGGAIKPFKNISLVKVPNPSPFSTHKGRGIHTLQPVALPNLSVSPLPPIFNARPFRLTTNSIVNQYKNHQTGDGKELNIVKSVPVAEFSSIEYPIKYTQSPLIDIDVSSPKNQTKSYRTSLNNNLDASSQASESQSSSVLKESSFEGTGTATGTENQEYEKLPPNFFEIVKISSPSDGQSAQKGAASGVRAFAYGNDQDLQAVDSPILYLKPSAPHKDFGTFSASSTSSTTSTPNDFEIYDDASFTSSSYSTTEPWRAITFRDFNSDLQPPPPYSQSTTQRSKIVQIIIPYTSGDSPQSGYSGVQEWIPATEDYENLARKVPSFTDRYPTTSSYDYTELSTTPLPTLKVDDEEKSITEAYEILRLNTPKNDLYDVKEPPFDIISLQHNIDGWTEQEFGSYYKKPQKDIFSGKLAHAKKIPDEFFTTPIPQTLYQTTGDFKSFYDHEFASSMYHSKKQNLESSSAAPAQSNSLENQNDKRGKDLKLKPYIYTAASSFRSQFSTTTLPPWGRIETSISPLTMEKVYVVTARPWRENVTNADSSDSSVSDTNSFSFKSPRFSNRPSLSSKEAPEDSHPFGKAWHQSINSLEDGAVGERRNSSSEVPASRMDHIIDSYQKT